MKCDHCDSEATVHEVTVRNGVKVEKHLCEACAAKAGLSIQPNVPLSELMSKFLVTPGAASQASASPHRAGACPSCRTTFAEFRQTGQLGCPDCYAAFEAQLVPLVERAHEGGIRHMGKSPARGGAPAPSSGQKFAVLAERAARLRALEDELKKAVTREEYERAARLRDELKKFGECEGAG